MTAPGRCGKACFQARASRRISTAGSRIGGFSPSSGIVRPFSRHANPDRLAWASRHRPAAKCCPNLSGMARTIERNIDFRLLGDRASYKEQG